MIAPEIAQQTEIAQLEAAPPAIMTGPEIARHAKDQLSLLTGLKPDTVSSLGKDEHGWHVTVEMIEMKRIPDSSDVLATYDILLDDEANLISYQRTERYYRAQVTEGS